MVTGTAFAAGESAKHTATLEVLAESSVVLRFNDGHVTCRIDEVTCPEPVGNLPVQLHFPDGALFIPDEPSALPLCFRPKKKSLLTRLESSKTAIVSSILGALLFVVLFFYAGLPAISSGIAKALPQEVPLAVGEHVMAQLDEQLFQPTTLSSKQQAAIQKQFNALVEGLPSMPVKPTLVFRNWEQGANAFALSDGTVVLLDPLVKLAENDVQLESVLLHELGHVYHQHVMTGLVRSTLISVSVAVITGESTGVIDMMTGLGVLAATSGYSRADEEASDRFAAKYLTALYGDATAQAEMFALMAQGHEGGQMVQWLSSHPDIRRRIKAAKNYRDE